MNHIIVFNVGGGNVWLPNARASVTAAAKRWNAQLHELTTYPSHCGNPFSAKFHLDAAIFAHASTGDRVLYLDADMLVRIDCPSPFDLVDPIFFGAVRNIQGDTHPPERGGVDVHHRPTWEAVCMKAGIATAAGTGYDRNACLNGGLLLWTVGRHERVFELMRPIFGRPNDPPPGIFEQVAMSVALKHLRTPMHWLPREFNRIGEAVWNHVPAAGLPAYICHWANYFELTGAKQKRRAIEAARWDVLPQSPITAR